MVEIFLDVTTHFLDIFVQEVCFEVIGPLIDRQFRNLQVFFIHFFIDACASLLLLRISLFLDGPLESSLPWLDLVRFLVVQHEADILHQVTGIEARDIRGIASADSVASIHEDHREDGAIPLWLTHGPIVFQLFEDLLVSIWLDRFGDGR